MTEGDVCVPLDAKLIRITQGAKLNRIRVNAQTKLGGPLSGDEGMLAA